MMRDIRLCVKYTSSDLRGNHRTLRRRKEKTAIQIIGKAKPAVFACPNIKNVHSNNFQKQKKRAKYFTAIHRALFLQYYKLNIYYLTLELFLWQTPEG